ncbi:MAG: GAF domain-containing protein [Anaerolineales bacterium]|nr:GAF domain-containing protein [Anaerolineales bacterium]
MKEDQETKLSFYFPRLKLGSLQAKILWPIAGLMMFSLLLSTLVFTGGTVLTRNRLLSQNLDRDTHRIIQVLNGRVGLVHSASQILADSDEINLSLADKTEANLAKVDSIAVVVRNRFKLDLIQVYDSKGGAWVNLVTSDLFKVSSLLPETKATTSQMITIDDHLLLVSRTTTPNGGVVITGIDLGSELERIARDENIVAALGLQVGSAGVTSKKDLSIDALSDQREHILRETELSIGGTQARLIISEPTKEINQVMQTGLWVVVLTSVLTSVILVLLGSLLIRSLIQPIQDLASLSQQVALDHNFATARLTIRKNLLKIGEGDEIGLLYHSYRNMLAELQDFYQDLESKVEARTRQIVTAAEVARATTSSLDLDQVLRTAVEQICSQFDYYFAGVFILDMRQEVVSLRQAAGIATMENDVNRIDLPFSQRSLITHAINKRTDTIVQDVSKSDMYLPLGWLPETRSEAVFPLIHAGMVIGALDIQSSRQDAFKADIVETLNLLALQIANAIQNAIIYDRQKMITNRLSEIDRLKAQLLDTMSHELRTPLNAIIGFSGIMLKGIDGKISEAQRSDLTSIYENGQHLLRKINDILDIAQFEAGEIKLNLRPMNLRQEVIFVISRLQDDLEQKGLQVEINIPTDMPELLADNIRIQQVLVNLVANAIKFTEIGTISISASSSGQWVIISVQDTGIGLASEDMKKLFHSFSQVDSSSTRRFEGIGLGLSIARYIVELHGGYIWVDSEAGGGSTFSFTLPLNLSVSRASIQMMSAREHNFFHERNM